MRTIGYDDERSVGKQLINRPWSFNPPFFSMVETGNMNLISLKLIRRLYLYFSLYQIYIEEKRNSLPNIIASNNIRSKQKMFNDILWKSYEILTGNHSEVCWPQTLTDICYRVIYKWIYGLNLRWIYRWIQSKSRRSLTYLFYLKPHLSRS